MAIRPSRRFSLVVFALLVLAGSLASTARSGMVAKNDCSQTRPPNSTFTPATMLWAGDNKWKFQFALDFQDKTGETAHVSFDGFAGQWEMDAQPSADGFIHISTFSPPGYWDSSVLDHYQYAHVSVGSCQYYRLVIDSWHLQLTPIFVASLGDSFSSGEGNPPFDNQACHRSGRGWPWLLSNNHYRIDVSGGYLACSGAKIDDLTTTYRVQKAQMSELHRIANTSPLNYVTITIGGNDVDFGKVLQDCFLPRHNCMRDGTVLAAMAKIKRVGGKLTLLYKAMKAAVQSWTKVLVVGYPQIFPDVSAGTHKCSWLAPEEQSGLVGAGKMLNQVIKRAATAAGVSYIDTSGVLKHHELCTPDSWMRPIGHTPIAYDGHPNQDGQRAIARAVRKYALDHLDYRFWP